MNLQKMAAKVFATTTFIVGLVLFVAVLEESLPKPQVAS
jgi:hypothetical protein